MHKYVKLENLNLGDLGIDMSILLDLILKK
jgi:hypothetical protein